MGKGNKGDKVREKRVKGVGVRKAELKGRSSRGKRWAGE